MKKWVTDTGGYRHLSWKGHRASIRAIMSIGLFPKPICYEVEVDDHEIGTVERSADARKRAENEILCMLAKEGKMTGRAFKDFRGDKGSVGSVIRAKGDTGVVIGIYPCGKNGQKLFYEREKDKRIDFEYAIFVYIVKRGNKDGNEN